MKNSRAWMLLVAVLALGCGDDIIDSVNSTEQLAMDNEAIDAYIKAKGYSLSAIDTTASGVRVVVLDTGKGAEVRYGDIVSMHLTGRFDEGEIFYTNIDTVATNNDLHDSTRTYNPLIFTHSQGGWSLREAQSTTGPYSLCIFRGFTDGTTAAIERINVGGKAVILSPSAASLGSGVPTGFSSREVLIFDLYPVHVK